MKVFVAGATGVVGRRAVRLLVSAGHDVTGVARSPGKAQLLRTLGAEPVSVDLFDPVAVTAAVAGHDVVCNLATHIPELRHASLPGAWNETIRLRTVASGHLVDAALATGAARFIQESIAFLYADGGTGWIDEEAALADGAFSGSVGAAEAQARRFTAAGGVGIALRFGLFYGAGASHTVDQLRMARRGVAPSIGSGDGYQSMIHLDDAAAAVVAALRAPAGTYNVVEDAPATRAEQADAIAGALGIDAPRQLPALIARLAGAKAAPMARSQRVSNRRFRAATGWEPAYPDQWSGWAQVVDAAGAVAAPIATRGRRLLVTAALLCLAATAAVEGVWAAIFPASFYRSFPGTGHWVEAFPPYNEHLVRDVGQLTLAMLVVTVGALVIRRRSVVRLVGLAWMVESLPHFLFHLLNRQGLGAAQQAASLTGLAFSVVLAAVCIVAPPADPPRRRVVPPIRLTVPVGAGHMT
jgi:nucleoside-diphosphate-sugar epimerase